MPVESKETIMDMPDNSGMAAEAIKEVKMSLFRPSMPLRI